jgi:hypothetical protein
MDDVKPGMGTPRFMRRMYDPLMEPFPVWKQDRPRTPHKLLNDLVKSLVDYYGEHLRRDREDGKLYPPDAWDLLRGFLTAAMQTYAGICILVADKRPKPLMLQAGILNRALFEILATVFGILEDPASRTRILLRESHKAQAERYQYLLARWGTDQDWREYFGVYEKGLAMIAATLGVEPDDALKGETITDEWPTPGLMIYGRPSRKIPSFVSGERREVLKEIYEYHYPHQSAQAHGRIAAMAVAILVDTPESQWNPGAGESDIVATAILFLACLLSELEMAGGYRPHPRLLELWSYLRDMNGEAKDLWALRYGGLAAR